MRSQIIFTVLCWALFTVEGRWFEDEYKRGGLNIPDKNRNGPCIYRVLMDHFFREFPAGPIKNDVQMDAGHMQFMFERTFRLYQLYGDKELATRQLATDLSFSMLAVHGQCPTIKLNQLVSYLIREVVVHQSDFTHKIAQLLRPLNFGYEDGFASEVAYQMSALIFYTMKNETDNLFEDIQDSIAFSMMNLKRMLDSPSGINDFKPLIEKVFMRYPAVRHCVPWKRFVKVHSEVGNIARGLKANGLQPFIGNARNVLTMELQKIVNTNPTLVVEGIIMEIKNFMKSFLDGVLMYENMLQTSDFSAMEAMFLPSFAHSEPEKWEYVKKIFYSLKDRSTGCSTPHPPTVNPPSPNPPSVNPPPPNPPSVYPPSPNPPSVYPPSPNPPSVNPPSPNPPSVNPPSPNPPSANPPPPNPPTMNPPTGNPPSPPPGVKRNYDYNRLFRHLKMRSFDNDGMEQDNDYTEGRGSPKKRNSVLVRQLVENMASEYESENEELSARGRRPGKTGGKSPKTARKAGVIKLQQYLWNLANDFPSGPMSDSITMPLGEIKELVKEAYQDFKNGDKEVFPKLGMEIGTRIIDEKLQCPVSKFVHALMYLLREEMENNLDDDDGSMASQLQTILQPLGLNDSISRGFAEKTVQRLHDFVFKRMIMPSGFLLIRGIPPFMMQTNKIWERMFKLKPVNDALIESLFQKVLSRFPFVGTCYAPSDFFAKYHNLTQLYQQFKANLDLVQLEQKIRARITMSLKKLSGSHNTQVVDDIMRVMMDYINGGIQFTTNFFVHISNKDLNSMVQLFSQDLGQTELAYFQQILQRIGFASIQPTGQPTGGPSVNPSGLPTANPSPWPTANPSGQPVNPSAFPTANPSGFPSAPPSVRSFHYKRVPYKTNEENDDYPTRRNNGDSWNEENEYPTRRENGNSWIDEENEYPIGRENGNSWSNEAYPIRRDNSDSWSNEGYPIRRDDSDSWHNEESEYPQKREYREFLDDPFDLV